MNLFSFLRITKKPLAILAFLLLNQATYGQGTSLFSILNSAKKAFKNDLGDSVIYYNDLLLKNGRKQDSLQYVFYAYSNLGRYQLKQNKKDIALKNYYDALKIAKQLNDLEKQAGTLNAIGSIYFDEKSITEALRLFKEELICRKKIGDSIVLTHTYINLAAVFRKFKEYDSSKTMLDKAKLIGAKLKDSEIPGYLYDATGAYYFTLYTKVDERSSYRDSAEKNWKKAYTIWKKQGQSEKAILPLFNLGYVYYTKHNFDQALVNYLQVKQIIDSLNLIIKKPILYGNLGELYYDMGKYKEAADLFRQVHEINDSLQRDELKKFAIKTERQYQLESKDKTILMQQLEISKKQQQTFIYIIVSIILVICALGLFIYFSFKRNIAKRVEEAKENFFTNVMHEVKTPLSMIQAPLKSLRSKINDSEGLSYLNIAEKNINRLNELISQMLDVSKIETNRYSINSSYGNITVFINDLITNFEKLAYSKNIHFVSNLQIGHSNLKFDKDALEKLIGNLLSNAIKYTPANGTVGLNLTIEEDGDNAKTTIEVWDTGVGISKQDQNKIFDRFFRSENTANSIAGVGIGLSLVKDITTALNGTIQFNSEVNKGSSFQVSFFLKLPEVIQNSIINTDIEKSIILLIEDDPDIINFLEILLSSKNYQTLKANEGSEALAILNNITPDIIITDLMMKGMDGLSFLRSVRSNKGLDHIPIIVLSAKSSPQARLDVLNAGALAFINKPFIPDEILLVISNQLELLSKQKFEIKNVIHEKSDDTSPEIKFSSTNPYTQKFFDLIFKNLDNTELSVELLADLMATNRSHFQRKIKKLTGYSPSELIKFVRLEKSKEFLSAKKGNVTEVSDLCGFSSQSYFTKCFTQHFGMSPSQFYNQ